MENDTRYVDFRIRMIEKTFDLYIKRLDVWEDQFFKIKYGCVTLVIGILWFRYSFAQGDSAISILALATTFGFWMFEASLRTTSAKYWARLDLLTDMVNDSQLMERILSSSVVETPRVLDFDVRTKRLDESVQKLITAQNPTKSAKERLQLAAQVFTQKKEITTLRSSIRLRNNVSFYGFLTALQLLALALY